MKKLLAVIDYQNDFVNGALGFDKAKTLECGIYHKVKEYLKNEDYVLFTYDTHTEGYLNTREGKNLPVPHCILGTEGHELYGKVRDISNDINTIHINKFSFGMSPENLILLKEITGEDIYEIEIVGIVTNMCVISNVVALQSQYINADIVVDSSLCGSFDNTLHEKALDVIEALQVKVINK